MLLFCRWCWASCLTSLTQQASSLILHTSVKLFANRWPDNGGSENTKQSKCPFLAWKVCRILCRLIFIRLFHSSSHLNGLVSQNWPFMIILNHNCHSRTGIYNCHHPSCLHSQYNKVTTSFKHELLKAYQCFSRQRSTFWSCTRDAGPSMFLHAKILSIWAKYDFKNIIKSILDFSL